MVHGALVLAALLAWTAFASAGVARRLSPRAAIESRAEHALATLLVFYALLVTPVFLLGYTGTLTRGRLALTSLALSTVVALVPAWSVGWRTHLRTTARSLFELAWLPIDALRVTGRARSVALFLVLAALILIVGSAVVTYLAPSESWDGLFYHEPMIGFALQDHGFAEVPLNSTPMAQTINGYPRGCESFALFFVAFSGRAWIEIGNTMAAPGLVLAIYLMARRFTDAPQAIGWSSLTLLMPAMWTELRTTYTDIQIIFFVVAALHFATRPVLRWRDAGMAFVAMALAIAGKGTGLTLVPPVAFVLAVRLVFWIPSGRRITALAAVLGIAVTLLAIAALTLVPNWHRHQNPVWPVTIDVRRPHLHLEGLIKYADMNPEGPWRETVAEKYSVPEGGVDDAHNRDYGYAFPWVVIPCGLLAAPVAVVVAIVQSFRRKRGAPPGHVSTTNLVVLIAVAVVWMCLSNNLRWARFNAQSLFVLAVAVAWAGGRPGWTRLGDGLLGAAAALALIPFYWMNGWYWGLSAHQLHRLTRMSPEHRATFYVDPNGMPSAVGAARDTELHAGDVLVFNQDETWIGLMWNADFSNVVEFVPSENAAQFEAELDQRNAKWVVIGKNDVAQRVVARHPERWEAVGTATIIDGTTAYRRKP